MSPRGSQRPPTTIKAAKEVIRTVIDEVFECASFEAGSHAPWEIEPEQQSFMAMRVYVSTALTESLPREDVIKLARHLHEVLDARDIGIESLKTVYETEENR